MNERLDWSEAEAVVRAYRAEHGMASDIDIATLARTLGTSPAEIRRLASRKRRFIDRSGVLSAVLAFAILGAASLTIGPRLTKGPIVAQAPRPVGMHEGLVFTNMRYDQESGTYVPDDGSGPHEIDLQTYPVDAQAATPIPDDKTL